MKLAFYEIKGWEKSIIKRQFRGYKIDFFKEPLTKDNASNYDVISVFIYSKVDKEILNKIKGLKLIATRSTGFDHIDLDECKKRKITVCNVPYYGENTVAEHTFALILALSRNVHKSYVRTLRRNFSIEGLKGFDLKGKTIGVIGAGHIGLHVIRIAKGFGMNVLAFDMNQNNFLAEVLGFNYVSMDFLLRNSDIITLHVPENKNTHHLIDKKAFDRMKKGAIIINTARGSIIDTDALIDALEKHKIAGAGLDVLEGEELIKEEKQLLYDTKKLEQLQELVKDNLILSKDNVVFTPHIGFYSQEALERILHTTIMNIKGYLNQGRVYKVV